MSIEAGQSLAIAFLLAAVAAGHGSIRAEETKPIHMEEDLEERVAVHLRTLRVRIEPTRAAAPGECRELDLGDLEVRLRGVRLGRENLIELDRELKPNLHALLLDMSGSMRGREEQVRHAAGEYVKQLGPDEKALIITFDESVILAQTATDDQAELIEAIGRIRLSAATSIHDGLYFAIRELDSHNLRPVIVLMTDGQDTGSLHRKAEILELIDSRPELTIFTVGIPPTSMREPKALVSLDELSARSTGKTFFAPGWHLENVFLQIRDLLDNEAMLTVNDPEPEAPWGRIKVRATAAACKVRPFRMEHASRKTVRLRPPFPESPARIPFPPGALFLDLQKEGTTVWADPRCGKGEIFLDELWFLQVSAHRIQGCSVDITRERGLLYSPWLGRPDRNEWVAYKTRWFDMLVPSFEDLPIHPVEVMDSLAEFAISVADTVPETLAKLPLDEHARPYNDYPFLMNGQMFFDARTHIAKALFVVEDYRVWLLEQLKKRSDEQFAALKAKFHRIRPDLDVAQVDALARSSETGKAILAAAEGPSDADLRGQLSAWIGDIAAHDLFIRWEEKHIDRLIGGVRSEAQALAFVEGWRELRRVFYLPSYARVLTLLIPFFDPDYERVGFRRVVLPRPGWMFERNAQRSVPSNLVPDVLCSVVEGDAQRSVPLDLVPDLPFAYWLSDRLFRESPVLASHLRDRGYRVAGLRYELLRAEKDDRNGRKDMQSFRSTRVMVTFDGPGSAESKPVLEITAHLRLGRKRAEPTLEDVELSVQGDSELQRLVARISSG